MTTAIYRYFYSSSTAAYKFNLASLYHCAIVSSRGELVSLNYSINSRNIFEILQSIKVLLYFLHIVDIAALNSSCILQKKFCFYDV